MLAGDLGLQLIERNIEILRDVKSRDEFTRVLFKNSILLTVLVRLPVSL